MFIDSSDAGRIATHRGVGYRGEIESVDGEFTNVRFWFGRYRVRTEDVMVWPRWKELLYRRVVKPVERAILTVSGLFLS